MERVTFKIPDDFVFTSEYKVRINDINYGMHLSNDRLLVIAQQARLEYLKSLGYKDELNVGTGLGIIVSDAAIIFKAEGFEGDLLNIHVALSPPAKYGFDMFYKVVRESDDQVIALIKTGVLFYNYTTKRLSSVPEEFISKAGLT